MGLFLLSEAVFFTFLIIAYLRFLSMPGVRAQSAQYLDVRKTAVFTVCLLLSSVTAWRADRLSDAPATSRTRLVFWLFLSLALGAAFLVGQGLEYLKLLTQDVTIARSPFGTDLHAHGIPWHASGDRGASLCSADRGHLDGGHQSPGAPSPFGHDRGRLPLLAFCGRGLGRDLQPGLPLGSARMTLRQFFLEAWEPEPSILIGCAALLAVYLVAYQRLGRAWLSLRSRWHAVSFALGDLLLLLALTSPLDALRTAISSAPIWSNTCC